MRQNDSSRDLIQGRRWIPRLFVAAGFTLLYTFGLLGTPATTHAAGVPGGNITDPFVRAVDIARPSIVRILTTVGGRLTVNFSGSQSATFPLGGGSYKLELSGSGAFISANGDILTADHVVHPPHDKSLDAYLDQLASSDVANYINEHFQVTQPYTADYTAALLVYGYIPSQSHYEEPTSEVYMSTDYTGPESATTMDSLPTSVHTTVDQIKKYSAFDQKDVAIVHVPRTDTPSIQVGDSSNVELQDELRIIGFPGNGDVSQKNDPTNFLTPSINQVFVSSIKTTDANANVIQVGGNVEHGDSGGPALDNNGNIVGVVSFGLQQTGDTGITSFLQASNSARTLLTSLNLDTKPGNFQTLWTQAFNDYSSTAAGHWHKASSEFNALAARYTDFKALALYQSYAKSQADHEQVPNTQPPAPDYTWYIVGGVIVLLVLLILIYIATRRRKQPLAAAVAGAPGAGFPAGQQYGSSPEVYRPALTPQYTPIGQTGPTPGSYGAPGIPGQTGQIVQGTPSSEDAMLTYPAAHMSQVPPTPASDQPGGTPSQPAGPAYPYQPVRLSSSEQWSPYQSGAQPAAPSPYTPAGQPVANQSYQSGAGAPYQPPTPSPYQPVSQSYQPGGSSSPEQFAQLPPTPRPNTGEVRPQAGQPYNAQPAPTPAPGSTPAPPSVPPWLRQDIYARPQAQPTPPPPASTNGAEQANPSNSEDQEKTVRSSGNIYGSNPSETEIRDRSV